MLEEVATLVVESVGYSDDNLEINKIIEKDANKVMKALGKQVAKYKLLESVVRRAIQKYWIDRKKYFSEKILPMKKYNIALLPVDNGAAFVEVSQKFSMMDYLYNLGEESLPHVTLCQFYREESEIEATWEEVCTALSDHALDLEFNSFSLITFDNRMFWISLMPGAAPELHKLQAEIASIVKVPNKRPYDPHLTLMSTLDSAYESKAAPLIEAYRPLADKFILALGECDELGQFIRIIYQKELTETIALTK